MFKIPEQYINQKKQDFRSKWKGFREEYEKERSTQQSKSAEEKKPWIEKGNAFNEESKIIKELKKANQPVAKNKLANLLSPESTKKMNHVLTQINEEGQLRSEFSNLFFSLCKAGGGGPIGEFFRSKLGDFAIHDYTELGIYTILKNVEDYVAQNLGSQIHPVDKYVVDRNLINALIEEAGLSYLKKLEEKGLMPQHETLSIQP